MRGRSQLVECCFCGRRIAVDKASRFQKRSFSYYDERAGLKHQGFFQTEYCCPSCARHRGIKNDRPMKGRPNFR